MAIDETGLIGGELYTIVINKKAKGKKGTPAAIESFHSKLKLFRQRIRGVNDKSFFFFRIIQYFA